jgi:four helix bundle protein
MTVKSYRELVCWQLSAKLRDELIEAIATQAAKRDFIFCDQIRNSARSVPSNIAEGFGQSARQFRRYVEIALGSLRETETHLDEALIAKYITEAKHAELRTLAKRAHVAACRLRDYLATRST